MAKPDAAGGKRWRKSKGGGNLGGRGSRCFGFLVFLAGVSVGFGVPRVFMFRTSKTDTIDPHSARSSFTNTKTSSPPPPRSLLPPPGKNIATSGKLISKEGEKNGLERAKTAETSRKFENSEKRNAENPGSFETGKEKKALIFTMDSLSSRVDESKKGGASGEMTIRICLQKGLQRLGFDVTVARSDAEFEGVKDFGQFRLIFLDPWTWAGKGWILKPFLNGHVDKIYLLDFFGSDGHKNLNHLVPLSRHLTAYPVGNSNTFLGYFIEQDDPKNKIKNPSKKPQGVIWGKDPKYYKNKHQMLVTIASASKLVSTAPASALPRHPNITSIGHISPQQWNSLLLESRFLVGLGDPLLGPSAVDAIRAGSMFLNPTFRTPKLRQNSQHPFASSIEGGKYTCEFELEGDYKDLLDCVQTALASKLDGVVPEELTMEGYINRIKSIFTKALH